jgi:hypothetical protein
MNPVRQDRGEWFTPHERIGVMGKKSRAGQTRHYPSILPAPAIAAMRE